MQKKHSTLKMRVGAVKRLCMWNILARPLKLVLVTEFPKSGASWFCQMMADASSLPFPRNRIPQLERCIMHGHQLFHPRMGKTIAVLRDGRDVMVSAYFHFLFENDRNTKRGVQYHRNNLLFQNYDDVMGNMPRFIEYMFTKYADKNMFHFSWSEFVQNIFAYPGKICEIKYESLLIQPVDCLLEALKFYDIESPGREMLQQIVENYSFKKISNRKPGEENRKSFVRKGISGDWRNYFNDEACEVFKNYGGAALVQAGYERDHEWHNRQEIETR